MSGLYLIRFVKCRPARDKGNVEQSFVESIVLLRKFLTGPKGDRGRLAEEVQAKPLRPIAPLLLGCNHRRVPDLLERLLVYGRRRGSRNLGRFIGLFIHLAKVLRQPISLEHLDNKLIICSVLDFLGEEDLDTRRDMYAKRHEIVRVSST